jgi:hypothetical protein
MQCASYCCSFVCCVLFERGVLFCVTCLNAVIMPQEKKFAIKINNNNNYHFKSKISKFVPKLY